VIAQLPPQGLSVERACQLLGLARSDYYRTPAAPGAGRDLLGAIEAIVLAYPGYGYRRVTAQLQRDGWAVNHKRVLGQMREAQLLCRTRRRWVQTTDSRHGLTVYPNLLAQRGWRRLTGINQAWVGDLTYIRLPSGFCYLAALLDAYSRRVVGWSLAEHLEATVVLAALEQALSARQPAPGWIHHSDRGVQYACRQYVERLQQAGARISMTAVSAPRQNAQAESFFRTLKVEAVYVDEYATMAVAAQGVGRFIEVVYNEKRLHSALGYRPPSEFEELLAAGVLP
jgi:putative transposase